MAPERTEYTCTVNITSYKAGYKRKMDHKRIRNGFVTFKKKKDYKESITIESWEFFRLSIKSSCVFPWPHNSTTNLKNTRWTIVSF